MRLKEKKIVVTGCSSGIGAAVRSFLQTQGAQVIGVDLRGPKEPLKDFFQADLTKQDSILDLIEKLPSELDGLCNIAGVSPKSGQKMIFAINTIGLKLLTLGLEKKFKYNASVVNLASVAGGHWMQNYAQCQRLLATPFEEIPLFCEKEKLNDGESYNLSKEAIIAWTAQNWFLSKEKEIRMNCVSPAAVQTALLEDFKKMVGEKVLKENLAASRKLATAENIAPVVAFLCSDDSYWIRGSNIVVDGGVSAFRITQKLTRS